MSNVIFKNFANLTPVKLQYEYQKNEPLFGEYKIYNDGLVAYELDGTVNFRDLTLNKNTCFILTSSINLKQLFNTVETKKIGEVSVSILLQPRNSTIYYAKHNIETNTIELSLERSQLFIQSAENNMVEILIDGKYLEISPVYPYTAFLNEKKQGQSLRKYQLFEVFYNNGLITLKTLTNAGYRYLAFNNDNTLRATGLVLNDSVVNDYIFKCIPITNFNTDFGFIPTNNWITYFYDIESKKENKTLAINKNIFDTNAHYLIEFPYYEAINKGIANLNFINLKTGVTPTGNPAPIDNTYQKSVITTN